METSRSPRKKRILVVDDHVAMTQLVKMLLEKGGDYIVREENQSLAVLETVQHFAPDLVVLDLNMPGMNGREIAAFMRDDPKLRHTAIVFLTGSVVARDASNMLDGYPCLMKPIIREEMIRVIEESVTRARTGWMKMNAVALPN